MVETCLAECSRQHPAIMKNRGEFMNIRWIRFTTSMRLFVSFGSFALTTEHDIVEIAHGLVSSEVNFVWVLQLDIYCKLRGDKLFTSRI